MYFPGSRSDIGTLVSPIGEAAVAMPAAMRFAARAALADFVARLYISLDDVEKESSAMNEEVEDAGQKRTIYRTARELPFFLNHKSRSAVNALR